MVNADGVPICLLGDSRALCQPLASWQSSARSRNYYARFYDKTKSPARKVLPLGTRDEAAAEAALKRLEVHHAEGRFDPWAPPERPPARLSEAVAAFYEAKAHRAPNTLRLYHTVLDGLLDHVGDVLVRDITPSDVLAFLNETGRDAYFTRLKAFFTGGTRRRTNRADALADGG